MVFRTNPSLSEHDVVVVGGGVAGAAAALAKCRQGCSVILLENGICIGGLATSGLVNLFVPLCNGRGIPILRGMAEEFLRTAIRFGFDSLNEAWRDGASAKPTKLRYATFFASAVFALQLAEKLKEEGVDLLYSAAAAGVTVSSGRCEGIDVLCEEGMRFCPAQVLVDASGSSAVFAQAGAETVTGRNYFSYHAHGITLESCAAALKRGDIRYALLWQRGGTADLYGKGHPEGMPFFRGDTSAAISDYLVSSQSVLLEKLKQEPRRERLPVALPGIPQLRTVRRIVGEYTLKEEDLYRHFSDSVSACCDSERRDSLYEIPFRALYNRRFSNLIAAGRNISVAGYLWDVTRVIPPAIVTGQAAGTAAALAVRQKIPIPELDPAAIQTELARGGVLIHFDDAWIPSDRKPGEYSPASHSSPDRYLAETEET